MILALVIHPIGRVACKSAWYCHSGTVATGRITPLVTLPDLKIISNPAATAAFGKGAGAISMHVNGHVLT